MFFSELHAFGEVVYLTQVLHLNKIIIYRFEQCFPSYARHIAKATVHFTKCTHTKNKSKFNPDAYGMFSSAKKNSNNFQIHKKNWRKKNYWTFEKYNIECNVILCLRFKTSQEFSMENPARISCCTTKFILYTLTHGGIRAHVHVCCRYFNKVADVYSSLDSFFSPLYENEHEIEIWIPTYIKYKHVWHWWPYISSELFPFTLQIKYAWFAHFYVCFTVFPHISMAIWFVGSSIVMVILLLKWAYNQFLFMNCSATQHNALNVE